MSRRKRALGATVEGPRSADAAPAPTSKSRSIFNYLRQRLWLVALIALLSLGVLGAGLKYLEDDAAKQKLLAAKDRSPLAGINPFVPAPPPPPTPQLSKEYLYAGSRLLAVEDANATAAPPADLAIWRPSTGVWWVMGQAGSQATNYTWGTGGDIPVPGDYDGDGKTDFSIYRETTGVWWVTRSSDGSYYTLAFGAACGTPPCDRPAPADYDGDGRTDAAVFRPNSANQTGTFYINNSSTGTQTIEQFGVHTDTPAPADYDGDGRADLAVWRNSNQTFYSVNTANGLLQINPLAQSGTDAVPSDYDGDGRADHAVYNSSSATWHIRQSTNGQVVSTQWGAANDRPVHNDYDGDGRTDLAVFNNAAPATWTIRKSSTGSTRTESFGTTGDIPVPAFYRR